MSEAITLELTPADDDFHPPPSPEDLAWTETSYFGFDLEERALSLAVYPLFRPNLGVCSFAIHLWDQSGVLPWELPYSKFLWHVPMPRQDLTNLTMEGLSFKVLEPLQRYFVGYHDPGRLSMELEFDGLRKAWGTRTQVGPSSQGKDHFDQDCRVKGDIVLNGERIQIDTFGHRDRSWYSRPDNVPRRSNSIFFGVCEHEQFLIIRSFTVGANNPAIDSVDGYLVRDGVRANIRSAERRVLQRKNARPVLLAIEATDELGRSLEATGRCNNTLAFNCSPPVFAWFSQVSWQTPNGTIVGEDQEAYSFADIGKLLRKPQ